MKKAVGMAAVLFTSVLVAVGQGPYSLQIADTAAPAQQNLTRIIAGTTIGEDSFLVGGRVSFYPVSDIQLFGDLGWIDTRNTDDGPSLQVGGLYTLPLNIPLDAGLRGAIYKPFIDSDISIWGATAGIVLGRDMEAEVQGLSLYGYIGLDYLDSVMENHIGEDKRRDDVNLALAAGVTFRLAPRVSVYGELSLVDDPFVGGGLRMEF